MTALLVFFITSALPDGGAARDGGLPPLIPRAVLYGSPELSSPQLSPDGNRLATLEPDENKVLQLRVRTTGLSDAVQLTNEPTRSLRTFRWTEDGAALLYQQDLDGDERFHVFALDLETKQARDLTPWPGAKSELLETNPRAPSQVLLTTNRRDAKVFDVVRVNWRTGEVVDDTKNPGDVSQWLVDAD
ncbi:MAG: hypothetical protein SFW67_21855, partial [Myxococcaceae bacterium]|nr:hypothetical protein [Myxococcaceae bacterium]